MKLMLTIFCACIFVLSYGQNTFPSSGNVGIGTATPQKIFDVQIPMNNFISIGSYMAAGNYSGIHFGYSEPSSLAYRKSAFVFERTDNAARGKIHFLNNNGNDNTSATLADSKMTIEASGNVGIGTTSPSNIQGWDRVFDVQGATNSKIISTTSGGTYRVGMFSHNSWNGGGGVIGTETNHQLLFITNYDAKMVIGSTGRIGMGTLAPYVNSRLHAKSTSNTPWGIISEALNNQRIVGLGHDGTAGIVAVSALDGSGFSPLYLNTSNLPRLAIDIDGNVGIGTTLPNQKLTVNGTIYGKEVKVDLSVPGPDYVFEKDYALPSLESIQTYIDQNKHLPEVPSAKEMEANGINLSEMNMILLKKVEELTLYVIEQQKLNEVQTKEINQLKVLVNKK